MTYKLNVLAKRTCLSLKFWVSVKNANLAKSGRVFGAFFVVVVVIV